MPADSLNWDPFANHTPNDPGWTLLTPDGRDPADGSRNAVPLVLPQLLAWVRMGRADRALDALQVGTCTTARVVTPAAWRTLTRNQQRDAIITTVANYTCVHDASGATRADPITTGMLLRNADIDAVVDGITAYINRPAATPVRTAPAARRTLGIQPAGAAFTEAASYTNGPTLLAAALAFVAGYAAHRYYGRSR